MIRIRFIERDHVFNRIKNSTKYLTDDDINLILDEQQGWVDYTFIFDVRPNIVRTIIHDNISGCDVAIADLNTNAKEFYDRQLHQYKTPIEQIRDILHKAV